MSKPIQQYLDDFSIKSDANALASMAGSFGESSLKRRKARLKANNLAIENLVYSYSGEGFDVMSDKEKCEALSAAPNSSAMKATISSVRDYTSRLAHYCIALGLVSNAKYVNSILEPDKFGVTISNICPLGLHRASFILLQQMLSEWHMNETGKKCVAESMHDYHELTEKFILQWHSESDPLAHVSEPLPPTPEASFSPSIDCSGFDLRETLNVFAIVYSKTKDESLDLDLLFNQMRMLVGINKSFVASIEKLSKNDEALRKLQVNEDEVSDVELTASIELIKLIESATTTTTTTTEAAHMTAVETSKYDAKRIDTTMLSIINSAMSSSKMGSFEDLCKEINDSISTNAELSDALAKARTAAAAVKMAPVSIDASSDGVIPKGKTVTRKVIDILDELGMDVPADQRDRFMFEVPYFVWESAHPHVPNFDADYQWRWDILLKIVWGISKNMKPWVHGHTGTGKTTLVEQACAILKWPFARINFDSEITRMDLIGNAGLETDEHGNTITKFVEGILPQMLAQPYVICGDEFDFVRSDIAYVFQRALEDKGLLLTEDAGRLVQPHPYSRIIATANTQGQGDEFGLYQGARVQSQAFLDRFQCWIEVPYLDSDKEKALVSAKVPSLPEAMVDKIIKYVCEHREAFKQAAILKPMSPRGVVSLASAISDFTSYERHEADGVRMALESTILGSVTHADAAKINELVDRTSN